MASSSLPLQTAPVRPGSRVNDHAAPRDDFPPLMPLQPKPDGARNFTTARGPRAAPTRSFRVRRFTWPTKGRGPLPLRSRKKKLQAVSPSLGCLQTVPTLAAYEGSTPSIASSADNRLGKKPPAGSTSESTDSINGSLAVAFASSAPGSSRSRTLYRLASLSSTIASGIQSSCGQSDLFCLGHSRAALQGAVPMLHCVNGHKKSRSVIPPLPTASRRCASSAKMLNRSLVPGVSSRASASSSSMDAGRILKPPSANRGSPADADAPAMLEFVAVATDLSKTVYGR
mmetsp:Transcript_132803/g.331320  ORF Transcript_132803/g.331320 Transcript_132803/m.331320 type:complete len:285 (+) Transcript_132803:237-1091(+)